jgi:undecaprenyl-diphosphatase
MPFDHAVVDWIAHHRHPALTALFLALTELGSTRILVLLTLGAVPAFWLAGRRGMALAMMVAMVGSSLLTHTLKLAFARPRPDASLHLDDVYGYSFPSGHTVGSVVFFTTLALLASDHVRGGPLRTFLVAYAALLGVLVAVSRVYLGVHHPSDVIAGMAIGAGWSLLVVLAEYRWRHLR